jgi:tight adherence protein B
VRTRWTLRAAATACVVATLTLLSSGAASAATSTIDYVEADGSELQVVVQLADLAPGEEPDLATVSVSLDGELVPAEAEALGDAASDEAIERTTVLALDVSNSMRGDKFDAAKDAANAFLDEVPEDVQVGLVTFASDVEEVQAPTTDREAVRAAIDDLELSPQTRLYDGLLAAIEASGEEGSRSVLLLSDGADTSDTEIQSVVSQVRRSEVVVDVVALAQTPENTALLGELASAGGGQVLSADDPEALTALFADQAANLASQVLVTVTPPAELAGREGTLGVTLQVDNEPVVAEAFVAVPTAASEASSPAQSAPAPVEPGLTVPVEYMYAGLAAATVALIVIVALLVGGPRDAKQDEIDRGIEAYTRKGAQRIAAQANRPTENQSMTQQAVAVAESVLEGQKGLEVRLGDKLEAAGMALKPAEWLLVHVGVTLGLGLIGLLLSGGNILVMLAGLFLGGVGGWAFLSLKHSRRLKAFKNQLADTLQLMSGALSAGLSLAQSVDTVVREGTDPMAGEFRRALIETRLGVEIEDALAAIADRMGSVDFEWVVMAIRIQRQVGGNLAELLNKVAETIREREYLERQVKTLSAEGRLSVWILGGLPPAFMGYLVLSNPDYVGVMFTSPLGWAMLVAMTVLLTVGIFWMKKLVKVEV